MSRLYTRVHRNSRHIPILAFALALVMLSAIAQAATPEFRGMWVHNWRPGLLSRAEVEATVGWAVKSNMNVLIAQVRRTGDAYYDSAYEPRGPNIRGGSDFDPLGYTIQQAHANGLSVYAWFNVCRVLTEGTTPAPNHVAVLHPEWLSKDLYGNTMSPDGSFLDPGVPEVREYIVQLVTDILGKYDVDGIALDYIRYPGRNWGYNDEAVALFNSTYGRSGIPKPTDPLWCDWRRERVTETVRAIYAAVEQQKPWVAVGAATVAWGRCPKDFSQTDAYTYVFQDWRTWMEQGILDANMPMNYKDPSKPKQTASYAGWIDGARRWSYGRAVFNGIMTFGSNTSGVLWQIRIARGRLLPGIAGFLFSQADCSEALSAKLKRTVYSLPAPVPNMPWKAQLALVPQPSEQQMTLTEPELPAGAP